MKAHLRRGAEQRLDAARVLNAGQLDEQPVAALAHDRWLDNAGFVDAPPYDLEALLRAPHGSMRRPLHRSALRGSCPAAVRDLDIGAACTGRIARQGRGEAADRPRPRHRGGLRSRIVVTTAPSSMVASEAGIPASRSAWSRCPPAPLRASGSARRCRSPAGDASRPADRAERDLPFRQPVRQARRADGATGDWVGRGKCR